MPQNSIGLSPNKLNGALPRLLVPFFLKQDFGFGLFCSATQASFVPDLLTTRLPNSSSKQTGPWRSRSDRCQVYKTLFSLLLTMRPNKLECLHLAKTFQSSLTFAGNIRRKHLRAPPMEQRTLRNVNNYLNTNIYSYLETSGGKSSNLYINVVHFFNTSVNQISVTA